MGMGNQVAELGALTEELSRLALETAQRLAARPELPSFLRLSVETPGYREPGVLARSEFDTATTCGNCAIVCFETLDKRARALKTLRNSGIVVENEDGRVRIVRPVEAMPGAG